MNRKIIQRYPFAVPSFSFVPLTLQSLATFRLQAKCDRSDTDAARRGRALVGAGLGFGRLGLGFGAVELHRLVKELVGVGDAAKLGLDER